MQDQMNHHEYVLATKPFDWGRNGGRLTRRAGQGPYSGQSLSYFSVYSS